MFSLYLFTCYADKQLLNLSNPISNGPFFLETKQQWQKQQKKKCAHTDQLRMSKQNLVVLC